MLSRWNFRFASLSCLCLAVMAGCGTGYQTVSLEGELRIDGKLVEVGGITFSPLDSEQGRGVYAPVVKGHYSAESIPVGNVRATFLALEGTGRQVTIMGKTSPESRIIVPPNYLTGIDLKIGPEDKLRDFDLTGP